MNSVFYARGFAFGILSFDWRDGEAVTQGSAKPRCAGSIPARASLHPARRGLGQALFMIRPEIEHEKFESEDETGFAEKQLDIDAEIDAGEWQRLRKYRTYQRRSRQWKIIATHKAISNRLAQLTVVYYKLVSMNPKQGEKMLKDLRHLRKLQEILLQCMVWEPKGELEEDMVPQEVWKLIE